ncbi:hypothetical protein WN944_002103 [Citrus x changshan-huyou]|uniref:Reverse transcriptase Ty1/copia-type domain-containing protein n=1 Tax=Citrus x changshan-huyou TaxID=2935761 RepID=A0AAP0MHY0_9ROSI
MLVAYALQVIDDDIPNTFGEALRSSESDQWKLAVEEEMKSLHQNQTWELVKLPKGKKAIGIDYNEVFSPVVKHTSICILLALVAEYELELTQLDVNTAFLHGDLEEEIYMIQPCSFRVAGKENHKFTRREHDHCVYFRRLPDGAFIYLLLYVNDILITSKNRDKIERLKKQLASEFEMKGLGDAQRILRMKIRRDKKNESVWLTQKSYLKKVLERFIMDDKTKPICIPLALHFKLSSSSCPISQEECDYMARVPYASVVGSLMYDMVCTKPDISQEVSMVSRYMHNPGKSQWLAVKWILRYLYGTVDVELLFKKNCGQQCIGYCDSDFAGDLDKQRSTTGYVFTLGGGPVSWRSILQSTIALSTTEAEYMAATEAVKEVIWLKGLLGDLGVIQENIAVFCDNQSAIFLAKNQTYHARTKHIDVKYHYVREIIEGGDVLLKKIETKDNPSDMLTKSAQIWTNLRRGGELLKSQRVLVEKEKFCVYNLDRERRTKVENIGDNVIILGKNSSKTVAAGRGFVANFVYFIDDAGKNMSEPLNCEAGICNIATKHYEWFELKQFSGLRGLNWFNLQL